MALSDRSHHWDDVYETRNEIDLTWFEAKPTLSVELIRKHAALSDPVIDELVNMVIQAPNREELVYRVRALDRVLLHHYYVIPHWHLRSDRVAYWNHLQRPAETPKNGIDLDNWWAKP